MNIIDKIINFFRPPKLKLTPEQRIELINKEYHFSSYDDNLIDEIYTKLINHCDIENVTQLDAYNWVMFINGVKYSITEEGMQCK